MADFLFLPYLAHGHVNPMLAVAAELTRRGERALFAVSARFAGDVAATGAEVLPVPGHDVRVPAGRGALGERAGLLATRWRAWHLAARVVRGRLAADRPDLVVADVRLPWARPVVRGTGVPLVRLCTTHTAGFRGRRPLLVNAVPEVQAGGRWPHWAWGVAPLVRGDEPEEPLAAKYGWGDGRPGLLVSPGTVFARRPAFFRRVAAEFAGSDWLVLMATGPTPVHELGTLPANVVARTWLPQRRLLRDAAVLFGHGGMNSVHEALLAGVPMMLAPRSREQAHTARRLVELGVAVRADGPVRHLAERVAADERMRIACQAMRARLRGEPGAALAAGLLAGIARGASGRTVTQRHEEPISSWRRR